MSIKSVIKIGGYSDYAKAICSLSHHHNDKVAQDYLFRRECSNDIMILQNLGMETIWKPSYTLKSVLIYVQITNNITVRRYN